MGPSAVDVLIGDETFVVAAPAALAPLLVEVGTLRQCWPDLELRVTRDRGAKGCQWAVSSSNGAATGTAEVWLEPWHDGTIVHLFLRLRAVPDRRGRVGAQQRELAWKRRITAIKDRLDADRAPGCPAG